MQKIQKKLEYPSIMGPRRRLVWWNLEHHQHLKRKGLRNGKGLGASKRIWAPD